MEKKESPNRPDIPSQSKLAGLSNRAFGVIKFILGVCLLPFVYSSSASFLNEFALIAKPEQTNFWAGVITFLIFYLFVWEPTVIYVRGQKILEAFFNFFKPLVRVAPFLLPIYTLILFIAYGILSLVLKSADLINYFVFLFGLSISFHLVFSAKSIRSKQGDFLKANYIFGFSLIYIINLLLLTFGLSIIFKEFSFVNFCNSSFQTAKNIFYAIFKQLFLK